MTERLDRIEALLESTGQKLNRTAEQQTKNTEEIDLLVGVVATSEAKMDRLMTKSDANETRLQKLIERAEATDQRFEVLRAEAATDRQEFRQSFSDAIEQMRIDREEEKQQADADRQAAREQADADRRKADERHSAQMEVIQTLLLELTKTNGNVTKLRDRMDVLERAN